MDVVLSCSYFLSGLIKKFSSKTVFPSYYLKLSLPVLLKCFLIFAELQPHVPIDMFLKKNVHFLNF